MTKKVSPGRCAALAARTRQAKVVRGPVSGARTWFAVVVIAAFAAIGACTTYEPAPSPPPPSTFDRSWSAALLAAQDEGVRITSEDRVSGIIRGTRDQQEVTMNVRTQADGNVRVEISQRGPKGSDPGLAGRISRAYDRRMGR
jgi:hypothetical protein